MGHTLHHQGLNLDEELLHAEREHDRRAAARRADDARASASEVSDDASSFAPESPDERNGR